MAAAAGIVTTMAGAHGGSPTLIHACVNKKSKIVRIVVPSAKCKKSERALDWPAQTAVGAQGLQGSQGVPGIQGPQGEQGDPGPPGINWLGPWNGAVTYEVGDAVSENGSSYIAIVQNTGELPGSGASWGTLAVRGVDGRDGEAGLEWQGVWNSKGTYRVGDAVEHQGSSWILVAMDRSGEPGVDSSWELLAAKGDPGPTGVPPAPYQAVVGNIAMGWIAASAELPIRGLELASTVTPGSGSGVLVEHTLKVTREIDSRSPSFMSSALQGNVANQENLGFELVATGQIDPYLSYSNFDSVAVTEIDHAARARNLETLTLQSSSATAPNILLGHPSLRPPAAGAPIGRLTFDGSNFFDLLASDWKLTGSASPEPLGVVRRLSVDTETRFDDFLDKVVYPSVRVELFTPGTTTVAMRYTLTNAWISKWVTAVDGSANVLPTEKLTIQYERFEQRTFNPSPASFCWDFVTPGACP